MNFFRRLCALAACLILLAIPALAVSAAPAAVPYSLIVNGKTLDLSDLPRPVYESASGSVMIPLRKTAEALGLSVQWLGDEQCAFVEDSVQSARVFDGSASVRWTGKLKIIDLTRDTTMTAPALLFKGYTYVPAQLFEEFFNTVSVSNGVVTVEPNVYTIDQPTVDSAA